MGPGLWWVTFHLAAPAVLGCLFGESELGGMPPPQAWGVGGGGDEPRTRPGPGPRRGRWPPRARPGRRSPRPVAAADRLFSHGVLRARTLWRCRPHRLTISSVIDVRRLLGVIVVIVGLGILLGIPSGSCG